MEPHDAYAVFDTRHESVQLNRRRRSGEDRIANSPIASHGIENSLLGHAAADEQGPMRGEEARQKPLKCNVAINLLVTRLRQNPGLRTFDVTVQFKDCVAVASQCSLKIVRGRRQKARDWIVKTLRPQRVIPSRFNDPIIVRRDNQTISKPDHMIHHTRDVAIGGPELPLERSLECRPTDGYPKLLCGLFQTSLINRSAYKFLVEARQGARA